MTTEKRLTDYLMEYLPADWFKMRVENTVKPGTPDMYLCIRGVSVWIECKAEQSAPVLRPAQVSWAMTASCAGARVLLLNRPRGSKSFYIWDWTNFSKFYLVTQGARVSIKSPPSWYGNLAGLIEYLEQNDKH